MKAIITITGLILIFAAAVKIASPDLPDAARALETDDDIDALAQLDAPRNAPPPPLTAEHHAARAGLDTFGASTVLEDGLDTAGAARLTAHCRNTVRAAAHTVAQVYRAGLDEDPAIRASLSEAEARVARAKHLCGTRAGVRYPH